MNDVTRRMRYGSKYTSAAKIGSKTVTGAIRRLIGAPPSTSMQAVMPSSSTDEPKSGWISNIPTNSTTTPAGFNMPYHFTATSSL